MRTLLSFIIKEFKHILRDRRTMLILLGLPVVQMLLFGFAISTEVRNADVAVFDPSDDAVTQRLVAEIDANPYFNVSHRVTSIAEIDHLFRKNKISLALVFPHRFASQTGKGSEARIQLIADGSEPNQAQMLVGYASQTLQQAIGSGHEGVLRVNTRYLFNPQTKSAYNFVPGVTGMILLIVCAMMSSVSIVREKETGTMEVLLVSPIPPLGIVVAKAVPYFVLSCVNLATILLLAKFVLAVPLQGSLCGLCFISMVYILLSLALGLFISNLVDTQMAAVLVCGIGLIMPTIVLSGLMFPIESMPPVLQYISGIVPARWYISAIRKIMIEGVEMRYVVRETLILCAMTLVLLAASVKRFKVRLS